MKFPGLKRIKQVYSIWTIIYGILLVLMIFFKMKIPIILLVITLVFTIKTLIYDYRLIPLKRKRVYWLEHGPFLGEVVVIWILASAGVLFIQGYVTNLTAIIALIGFILDLWKDMKEDPKVYKN